MERQKQNFESSQAWWAAPQPASLPKHLKEEDVQVITIDVPLSEYTLIVRAAELCGMTVEDFIIDAALFEAEVTTFKLSERLAKP